MLKVKIFSINTTNGEKYGLVNANSGDVLHNATAKWKTTKGAEKYAAKMKYMLVK